MHGMLFSPGIYSQEGDAGRQSLAMKGVCPGFYKASMACPLLPGIVTAWAHTFQAICCHCCSLVSVLKGRHISVQWLLKLEWRCSLKAIPG